jgi:mannonate dehydratase
MEDAPSRGKKSKATRRPTRRRLLAAALVTAGGCLGARHGFLRLARPAAPDGPLSPEAGELVRDAWRGIDAARALDCHVHVIGLGVGGTGCYVNERMRSLAHPFARARFEIYRRAAGVEDLEQADEQYAARLAQLARQQLARAAASGSGKSEVQPFLRVLTLAFDRAHRDDGSVDDDATEFHVPNDYVLELAQRNPDVFVPAGSIHPYRADAVSELGRIAERGARAIKWLPSAMRIDPASPRCDAFYAELAARKIPLLCHAGEEKAVEAEAAQKLSNPLRLRRALDAGVKVIVAHCASSGADEDLDAAGSPLVPSFELFLRLMDDPSYQGRLFGDVSALAQANRCERLAEVLARTDLHPRLVNGSDYPLPAINALVRTSKLVELGLLEERERELLNEIDRHNPLLFDFVLKRTVKAPGGQRFDPAVFMPAPELFPS